MFWSDSGANETPRGSKFYGLAVFRKVQIFIPQSTDFHFAKYRFSPFRKVQIFISQSTDLVSFHFVSQSTISPIFLVTVENFIDGMRSEERSLQRSSGVRMIYFDWIIYCVGYLFYILFCLVWFGLVLFGLVLFGFVLLVSFWLVSFYLVSFRLVSFCLVSFCLVSFWLVSFHLVSFRLVSFRKLQ